MTTSSKAIAAFVIGATVGAMVGYFIKTDKKVITDRKVVKKAG